jgi:hypothetical protein
MRVVDDGSQSLLCLIRWGVFFENGKFLYDINNKMNKLLGTFF